MELYNPLTIKHTQSTQNIQRNASIQSTNMTIVDEINKLTQSKPEVRTDIQQVKIQVILQALQTEYPQYQDLIETLEILNQNNLIKFILEPVSQDTLNQTQQLLLNVLKTQYNTILQSTNTKTKIQKYLNEINVVINTSSKVAIYKLQQKAKAINTVLESNLDYQTTIEFIYSYEYLINKTSIRADQMIENLVKKYFNKSLSNYSKIYETLSDIDNKTDNLISYIFGRPNCQIDQIENIPKTPKGKETFVKHYETSIRFLIQLYKTHHKLYEADDATTLDLISKEFPSDAENILPRVRNGKMDFTFLPESSQESCQYLMRLLHQAKPPRNEKDWNYLHGLICILKNISYDVENKAIHNPNKTEAVRDQLIQKLNLQTQLTIIQNPQESDVVLFQGYVVTQNNIHLPFLLTIAPNKTDLSQLRKRNAKGEKILDILRCTIAVTGSSTNLDIEDIKHICINIFSFFADFLGDNLFGNSRFTFKGGKANPYSMIEFAKIVYKLLANDPQPTNSGFQITNTTEIHNPYRTTLFPLEVQIKFQDDSYQDHQTYGNKQLSAIFQKTFPSFKAGLLNQIHYLTVNKPSNISGNIQTIERKKYLWNLGCIINFLTSEDPNTVELKEEILNMNLQKENKEIEFFLPNSGQTVQEILFNILQQIVITDFTMDDLTFLKDILGIQLNQELLLQIPQQTSS